MSETKLIVVSLRAIEIFVWEEVIEVPTHFTYSDCQQVAEELSLLVDPDEYFSAERDLDGWEVEEDISDYCKQRGPGLRYAKPGVYEAVGKV